MNLGGTQKYGCVAIPSLRGVGTRLRGLLKAEFKTLRNWNSGGLFLAL